MQEPYVREIKTTPLLAVNIYKGNGYGTTKDETIRIRLQNKRDKSIQQN